ncbi:glucocorticoid receptor DNA binding factor [Anopheles sinensis]|uniref:Glucocorticoid receptor DNA binding factor n=1 Tax=Anopheles sinensis TaxID=74873 RepID=A0A084WB76_ANOSI|nr:glucocorticoid receptor DNA binding factor [Anopheles sinensis]
MGDVGELLLFTFIRLDSGRTVDIEPVSPSSPAIPARHPVGEGLCRLHDDDDDDHDGDAPECVVLVEIHRCKYPLRPLLDHLDRGVSVVCNLMGENMHALVHGPQFDAPPTSSNIHFETYTAWHKPVVSCVVVVVVVRVCCCASGRAFRGVYAGHNSSTGLTNFTVG